MQDPSKHRTLCKCIGHTSTKSALTIRSRAKPYCWPLDPGTFVGDTLEKALETQISLPFGRGDAGEKNN